MPNEASPQVYPAALEAALKERNLPSLDGLRAIAVSVVVFYHSGLPVGGGLGVLMFFVISGFLITWLLLQEEQRFGNVSLKLFYVRRSLRIFPAFYVLWLLEIIVFGFLGKGLHKGQAAASFFYVTNYYQALLGDPDSGLSHTWSLAIEEQFYLLWPLTFILLASVARRKRTLMAAIGVVWIYREMAVLLFHVRQGYVYEALDMRIDHLLLGCLLATVLFQHSGSRLWQVICAKPWTLWITLSLLAVSSQLGRLMHGFRYRDSVGFIVEPILTGILIVQGLAFGQSAARWLNWGWMRWIGRMSYSIYLYQQITIYQPQKLLRFASFPVRVAGGLICCLIVSAGSYYLVERPFLAMKERLGKRKQSVDRTRDNRVLGVLEVQAGERNPGAD